MKRSSDLPVIEQWEAYMFRNYSCFEAIEEEHLLEGTRLLSSLEKKQLFLPERIPHGLSSFPGDSCEYHPIYSYHVSTIIIGGDEYSNFHLLAQPLDGLFELGWVRVSESEAAKSDFHSFVCEQRQLEVTDSRYRVPINSVFGFCNPSRFRSWRNLHKVSIILVFWWLNTCAACRCFNWQHSWWVVRRRSETHPYCVSRRSGNRPWEGEGGSRISPRFRASSSIHPEENSSLRLGLACWTLSLLPQMLFDTAPTLTLGELLEWRLAPWSPKNRVGRISCCGGKQSRIHGSVGLVQTLLHHQLLVRLRSARLSRFLMLLRWNVFNILTGIIKLVSLVAADLCQVPERVKKASSSESCGIKEAIFCWKSVY